MATTTSHSHRKTVSVNDYPEHLNPFHEEDNHNKIRFWTIGRKLNRSNSFVDGFKDLRNTWTLKSFMKKGKKNQESSKTKPKIQVNGDSSPIVYRRGLEYSAVSSASSRATVSGAQDRYVYGGSVTPLPRSRFQERMRSTSNYDQFRPGTIERASFSHRSNAGSRNDLTGSRLSVESTNPFEDGPEAPPRASRRKKKRAPPPPPRTMSHSLTANSFTLDSSYVSEDGSKDVTNTTIEAEEDITDPKLNIELKIVEDDVSKSPVIETKDTNKIDERITVEEKKNVEDLDKSNNNDLVITESPKAVTKQDDNDDNDVIQRRKPSNDDSPVFERVNIVQYRRNSSLNEDQIRLRRGNLEDIAPLLTKRSQSLSNNIYSNGNVGDYDIPLHIDETESKDINDNTEQPQKLVCKLFESSTPRKHSVDNSISSTEREFIEIDKATRHLEFEIRKLNESLSFEDTSRKSNGYSVSDMKMKFERSDIPNSPNPIPKPRRTRFDTPSPIEHN